MQKKNVAREGRATRIPAEPEIEQLVALLDAEGSTQGQLDIINHTLRELSDETGVNLPRRDADLRDFYLDAAYRLGAANPRWRMREVFKMIAGGEQFDDYKKGDILWVWKAKRQRRNHSGTKQTAAELERRLSDPATPDDYRNALKRALCAVCAASGTKYNSKDPAGSYIEAEAEAEMLSTGSEEWHAHYDARSNLLNLLEGLRKRRSLSAVEVRGRSDTATTEQPHATPAEKPCRAARGELHVNMMFDLGSCGFVRGEIVKARPASDLRPGDIAAVKVKGDSEVIVSRVAAVDKMTITLRCDDHDPDECDDHTFKLAALSFLGRVDADPVGRWDAPTGEDLKHLQHLRQKLEEVSSYTDWENVLSSTRYRIEKQIYDIEHPTGSDPDDWSEWEKDEQRQQ